MNKQRFNAIVRLRWQRRHAHKYGQYIYTVLSKFLSLYRVSTGINRAACASGDEHLFWNRVWKDVSLTFVLVWHKLRGYQKKQEQLL